MLVEKWNKPPSKRWVILVRDWVGVAFAVNGTAEMSRPQHSCLSQCDSRLVSVELREVQLM